MGYFQVRYDSKVVIYNRCSVSRLTTDLAGFTILPFGFQNMAGAEAELYKVWKNLTLTGAESEATRDQCCKTFLT